MEQMINRVMADAGWVLSLILMMVLPRALARPQVIPLDLTPQLTRASRQVERTGTQFGAIAAALGLAPGPGAVLARDVSSAQTAAALMQHLARQLEAHEAEVQRVAARVRATRAEIYTYGDRQISFHRSSAELDLQASRPALDQICAVARSKARGARAASCPVTMLVEGHACLQPMQGQVYENVTLSARRAQVVADWVYYRCLRPHKLGTRADLLISVRGAGPWSPARGTIRDAANQTAKAAMSRNRRVEISYRQVTWCTPHNNGQSTPRTPNKEG